jgi:hypothetical protein
VVYGASHRAGQLGETGPPPPTGLPLHNCCNGQLLRQAIPLVDRCAFAKRRANIPSDGAFQVSAESSASTGFGTNRTGRLWPKRGHRRACIQRFGVCLSCRMQHETIVSGCRVLVFRVFRVFRVFWVFRVVGCFGSSGLSGLPVFQAFRVFRVIQVFGFSGLRVTV